MSVRNQRGAGIETGHALPLVNLERLDGAGPRRRSLARRLDDAFRDRVPAGLRAGRRDRSPRAGVFRRLRHGTAGPQLRLPARALIAPAGALPPAHRHPLRSAGWAFRIHGDRRAPPGSAPVEPVIDFRVPHRALMEQARRDLSKVERPTAENAARDLRAYDIASYNVDVVQHAWITATDPAGRAHVMDPCQGRVRALSPPAFEGAGAERRMVKTGDWDGNRGATICATSKPAMPGRGTSTSWSRDRPSRPRSRDCGGDSRSERSRVTGDRKSVV